MVLVQQMHWQIFHIYAFLRSGTKENIILIERSVERTFRHLKKKYHHIYHLFQCAFIILFVIAVRESPIH